MSRSNNIHEVSETLATFERQLENGQTLLYQMQVLQQPERARACGMGAKSHADRRPVDPPPVVELRLFSGPDQQDVTFSHNSNFFLYASLEHARPVAQARGMPAPAPAPVLTGVPVSGMAYLDRPAPAGYFIFPDLSVRHEGRYRLRFALYEDTKEQQVTNDPHEPREYCVHRLDVKSKAFTVFSAKKFPGLAESTALSRIVAEQGCRVRIRRDVRMRRRNDRPRGRDSEDSMDETAMLRAQRRHTPDQYDMEDRCSSQPPQHVPTPQYQQPPYSMHRSESVDSRKRSGSDVSVASIPDVSHTPRYNAGQYMPPAQNHNSYGHPVPTPPPPPQQQHSVNHLSFGTSIHPAPPPAPPSQQYAPQPQVPSQDVYGRSGYMGETHSRPHSQYQAPPPPSYHNTREQLPSNGQRRNSIDEYRQRRDSDTSYHKSHYRPGTPVVPQPQAYSGQMSNGYAHQQPQYAPQAHPPMYIPQQQQQQPLPPPPPPQQQGPAVGLPPLRLPPISDSVPRVWSSQPPTPSATVPPQNSYPPPQPHRTAPPPPPQSITASQIPIPSPSQFPTFYSEQNKYTNGYAPTPPQPPVETPKKRPWGRVFNTAHTEGSLRGGMRPDIDGDVYGSDASAYVAPDPEGDGYDDIGKLKMTYRRADGVEIVRKLHGEA
ncbi:velvet factor-domain-containing protein [Trichophaea hybrida]|nr:velvet factor-domain-containing protein [Trichophaea hybrida]